MQNELISINTPVKTGRRQTPPHPNPVLSACGCNATFVDRFWKYVKKTESCWLWTGHLMIDGYGHIAKGPILAGPMRSHRASWLIHNGEIPDGLWVLHNCPGGDNRACVNPGHLWLGTSTDNNRDMVQKGTHISPRVTGECHGMAKLDWEKVIKIREMWITGGFDKTHLARLFLVSDNTISRVVNNRGWNRR